MCMSLKRLLFVTLHRYKNHSCVKRVLRAGEILQPLSFHSMASKSAISMTSFCAADLYNKRNTSVNGIFDIVGQLVQRPAGVYLLSGTSNGLLFNWSLLNNCNIIMT